MKYLVAAIVYMVTMAGFAQQSLIDSLKHQIDNFPSKNEEFVDLRIEYLDKNIFSGQGDSTLLEFAQVTKEIADDLGYKIGSILSFQKIGIIHQFYLSNPSIALDYYQDAMDLIGDDTTLHDYKYSSLNNTASIYYYQREFELALEKYKKVMREFPDLGIQEQYIGNTYGEMNMLDSSVFYLEKAIERARVQENYPVIGACYANLSIIYSRLDRLEMAKMAIDSGLFYVTKYDLSLVRPVSFLNASEVYLKTGDLELSEQYSREALKQPVANQNLFIRKAIYGTLFDALKVQNKYKEALEAYENYVVLNDSITRADNKVEISRKEIEFEAKQRELIANQKIERQKFLKNLSIFVGVAILLVMVVIFYLFQTRLRARARSKEAEFNEELAKTKLVALRSQLNPHFIFNALSAINQFTRKRGIEEGEKYLVKFSKLIRSILENSDDDWVTLKKDLELTSWYMDIESLRLDNGCSYNIKLEDGIDGENIQVPSLLLQPFIENSFRHGLSEVDYEGKIDISIQESDGLLKVSLEDNGKGMDYENTPEHHSMGIEIIKKRIQQVSSLLGRKGTIDLFPRDKGIKVLLAIPYKQLY